MITIDRRQGAMVAWGKKPGRQTRARARVEEREKNCNFARGSPRAERVFTGLLKKVCYAKGSNESSASLELALGVSGTLKINREYYIVFYSRAVLPCPLSRIVPRVLWAARARNVYASSVSGVRSIFFGIKRVVPPA